uniref:VPS9 domain-containing protein n=1 Tax=Poecilia mexicana TaxID=48701 RepID=A0A3B3X727_9TELE
MSHFIRFIWFQSYLRLPGLSKPGLFLVGYKQAKKQQQQKTPSILQDSTQTGSQRAFSVLDRLLLTHPVWLQLSLNQDSALYVLLREPVGTFLVRKCSSSQRKVLCLRVAADRSASSVKECFICEEDSNKIVNSDLNHLKIAFPVYITPCFHSISTFCFSRDVLPFPLQLPEAIAKATTHRQLEAISHMGQGKPITNSHMKNESKMSTFGIAFRSRIGVKHVIRSSTASNKRHRFKRSMRLRLSESSMNLSLEGVGSFSPPPSLEQPGGLEGLQKASPNPQRRVHAGAGGTVLGLERRPAPSLAELDSCSSFSSMDDEHDSDSEPESMAQIQTNTFHRPPLVRSRGRGGMHRMSEAFVCFFAPDKRLTRLVEELARDRRSVFGGMVQDFLQEQRKLLQSLRLFLSQAKCCLLDSRELEPPIETLVLTPEHSLKKCKHLKNKPLKCHLEKALTSFHSRDGSTQCLTQNLLRLKGNGAMERLGVRTGVPDAREVERVKQKLILMQRTHSPIDKVLLLLQVCKFVHKAMGTLHGGDVSWDDFLPALSYVIVECNRPHLLVEVEYMMELLEPSWLGGEGTTLTQAKMLTKMSRFVSLLRYLLTSVCHQRTKRVHSCFSLSLFLYPSISPLLLPPPHLQRCVRILFQDGERSAVRTLQWRAGETSQALAQLCASTFGVSDPQQYTLFWRSGGEMRALPPQAQPQDLASHSEGGPSLSYLRTDHDFSKMRRLTRGGAVDLSESVCEE